MLERVLPFRGPWLAAVFGVSFSPVLIACSEPGVHQLQVCSTSVPFSVRVHGAHPPAGGLAATNAGTGTLEAPTASTSYASGDQWLTVKVAGAAVPYTVSIQPTVASLHSGTYQATVTLTSTE